MNGASSRARLVGAVALVAVFIAGMVAGAVLDRFARPRPGIRASFGTDMSAVLDRLQLTNDQRARAEAIIQRRTPRTEAMMLELSDRLRAIADSVDAELRSILTPEQRARLDSLRPEPKLMLKRKVVSPDGGTITDTLVPRPAAPRP